MYRQRSILSHISVSELSAAIWPSTTKLNLKSILLLKRCENNRKKLFYYFRHLRLWKWRGAGTNGLMKG